MEKGCGVYKWVNLKNGKAYVGSSKEMPRRIKFHEQALDRGDHQNKHLQDAWNKYGAVCFRVYIIEECVEERLLEVEQFWIDTLKSADREFGYNICPVAGATRGVKYSAERKRQCSELHKEHLRRLASSQRGVKREPFSEEQKRHMSESGKGKHSRVQTPEEKAKRSATYWSKTPAEREAIIAKRVAARAGYQHSPETKARMSDSAKGPAETTKKGRDAWNTANSSRVRSDEEQRKRSQSLKASWAKRKAAGFRHSQEARERMREGHKNIPDDTRQKMSASHKGIPWSQARHEATRRDHSGF
jgi:group I intron endonuclease